MTWLYVVIGAFVLSFVSGVLAYPDGPEPGFVAEAIVFGVVLSACGLLGMLIA